MKAASERATGSTTNLGRSIGGAPPERQSRDDACSDASRGQRLVRYVLGSGCGQAWRCRINDVATAVAASDPFDESLRSEMAAPTIRPSGSTDSYGSAKATTAYRFRRARMDRFASWSRCEFPCDRRTVQCVLRARTPLVLAHRIRRAPTINRRRQSRARRSFCNRAHDSMQWRVSERRFAASAPSSTIRLTRRLTQSPLLFELQSRRCRKLLRNRADLEPRLRRHGPFRQYGRPAAPRQCLAIASYLSR